MAVVVNRFSKPIFIPEIEKKIPADGKTYILPMDFADKYSRYLYILPDCVIDDVNNMKEKIKIEWKNIEIERKNNKEEIKRVHELIKKKKEIEHNNQEKQWKINLKSYNKEKIKIIYSFHFNKNVRQSAYRLCQSIESIINQNVQVCVCNTSKYCIHDFLKHLGNVDYVHNPINVRMYCKPKTINYGVKHFIKNDKYFLLSDIDLIYPPNFIDNITKYTVYPVPVRLIFNNHNLGKKYIEDYSFDSCKKSFSKNEDQTRTPKGIAPGNGLIHTESFNKINGFDEAYKGYGLEDADFNMRIGYICKYIELDNHIFNTYHMYHKLPKENKRFYNNKNKYLKKKTKIEKQVGYDYLNIFEIDKHIELIKVK